MVKLYLMKSGESSDVWEESVADWVDKLPVPAWNRNCQQWNNNYGPLPYHYSRIYGITNSAISNHLNHTHGQWQLNAINILNKKCMQKIIQCNKKKTIFQSFMNITQGNNYPSWFTLLLNCNINWGNDIYALPLQTLPTTY
jgi:hypothetical protein